MKRVNEKNISKQEESMKRVNEKIISKQEESMKRVNEKIISKQEESMKRVFGFRFALAVCMVSVMILLSGCRTEEPINESPSDTSSTTQTDSKRTEITNGYDLESSKPMPSQRIALKCYSFYPTGEKVTVKASMGDNYTYSEEHNSAPAYSTYGQNGRPVFEVYPSDRMSNKDLDSSNVQINKCGKEYRKEFEKDELEGLDYSDFGDDVSQYYYEDIELDFSSCAVGESGTVKFVFGWQYETVPSHLSEDQLEDKLWEGYRRQIGYYVSDDGVYLNFSGAESAEEDAKR